MCKFYSTLVFTTILFVFCFSGSNLFAQTSSGLTMNALIPEKKTETKIISVQEDSGNQLGLIYTSQKLEEASVHIKNKRYPEAEQIIITAKDWLTSATDYHFMLYEAFSKYPKFSNITRLEKAHAIDFAKLRDQAYFMLARLYITEGKLQDAVSFLVEIVGSQTDSKLGIDSYKLLQKLKFSDVTKETKDIKDTKK